MNFDNENMTVTNMINTILTCEGVKKGELASRLGKTTQALSMKFKQGDFKESDLVKIGEALGYDVIIQFRKREK